MKEEGMNLCQKIQKGDCCLSRVYSTLRFMIDSFDSIPPLTIYRNTVHFTIV
jgi:hypothetical protein